MFPGARGGVVTTGLMFRFRHGFPDPREDLKSRTPNLGP